MALEFLAPVAGLTIDDLEGAVHKQAGRAVSTLRLAIAAKELCPALGVRFVSEALEFHDDLLENHSFYQRHGDMNVALSRALLVEARSCGVACEERAVSLEELLTAVTDTSVPIALVDATILERGSAASDDDDDGDRDYRGHFVVVVGFDDTNVVFHDSSSADDGRFRAVPRAVFDAARTAPVRCQALLSRSQYERRAADV